MSISQGYTILLPWGGRCKCFSPGMEVEEHTEGKAGGNGLEKTSTSVITKVAAAGVCVGGGYPGLLKPQALNSSHNLARGILTSTPDGWDINNSPCFTDVKPRHGEVRHFA